MKIAVLFTKLTGYFMASMRQDVSENKNTYLVFRKAPSPQAPFKINSENGITINDADDLLAKDLMVQVKAFNPEIIYLAGWTDKRYLAVAEHYKKMGIPTITGLDNQWLGNLKQRLASWLSPFVIKPYFSHVWVAGIPQYYYAKKLGFKDRNILIGLYCADENLFKTVHQNKRNKQFLFIGRMVEHKGLKQLFKVLNELINEKTLDFNIHFVGNGPLENQIPSNDFIKHTPFVDPKDLPGLMENAGYFLLPSLYEAWGVVVHEAALAGMPIITTHQTGAASDFVIHNYNGFLYNAFDKDALKNLLITCSNQSEVTYLKMAQRSKQLAKKINLSDWAAKINSLYNG